MSPGEYRKALVAGLVALLGALASTVDAGLSLSEWLAALAIGAGAAGATFGVSNAGPDDREAGHGSADLLVAVLVVVVVLALLGIVG